MKTTLTILLIGVLFCTEKIFSQAGQLDPSFGQGGVVTTAFNVTGDTKSYSSALQDDGKVVAAGYFSDGNTNSLMVVRYNPEGSLDNTFGVDGMINTQTGNSSLANAVAIQADGRIVAEGTSFDGSTHNFVLVRYNINGSLDSTLGTDGIVSTPINNSDSFASSIAIQPDGKILAGGLSSPNGGAPLGIIIRYNPDGSPDNTFGTNGIVSTGSLNFSCSINFLALQNDGKIVAGGSNSNGNNFVTIRYNSDGTPDTTFGTGGIVTTTLPGGENSINSVTIQQDGKILAGGYSQTLSDLDFTLIRYNLNGSLDDTFGNNGIVITQAGTGNDYINSVKLQDNGQIVAAGSVYEGTNYHFALARYNPNGSTDNTFGVNGIVTTQIKIEDDANSIIIQNNGKLIASGYSFDNSNFDFTLARYNINGALDNTFGESGIVSIPLGNSNDVIYSSAIQSNGKIIAGGYSSINNDYNFSLARYNTNGTLDDSFGTHGIVITPIGNSTDAISSVALQSDGKILAAGYANAGSYYDFVVVRYNTDGTLDNSFGDNGIVTTNIGAGRSLAIQPDGKIIVAGYFYNGNDEDFALVRYNTNGSLDLTFGTNGVVSTQIGSSDDVVTSVVIQNDGKIIAAGRFNDSGYSDAGVARYNPDGSLDETFGSNGIVTTSFPDSSAYIYSAALQGDGKIIIAGYLTDFSIKKFLVLRYKSNGDPDDTFGNNGIVITQAGILNSSIRSIAVTGDGKILAAGLTDDGGYSDFAIASYDPNGDLDNSFGNNGILKTNIGFSSNIIYSLKIQNDGKLVAAGTSNNDSGVEVFTLARYSTDQSTGVNEEVKNSVPSSFSLSQNYPNPFNPTTKIKYTIPAVTSAFSLSKVTLKVYDILGREVTTLVNGEKPAGNYEVKFNGSELASGVYLYRLIVKTANANSSQKEFVSTKKLILLK